MTPQEIAMGHLAVGDMVGLPSHFMMMTVEGIDIDNRARVTSISESIMVHCVWFDKQDQLHRDVFPCQALRKVETKSSAG